jgi:RNA recognition motif-containing protein
LLQRLFDAGSACLRPPCLVLARISILNNRFAGTHGDFRRSGLKNIYVGNISFQTSEQDLSSAFSAYGQVDRVQIIKDRETGQSRGFAFVEMPVDAEADRAIQALDGAKLDGRAMKVNEAQPREPRRGPGGGGGYDRPAGGGGPRGRRDSRW